MEKLALFDVDFTITRKETLLELFKFVISRDKKNLKFIPRAVFCGLMYGLGVYDEKRVKEAFIKFVDNIEEKELKMLVKEYYRERLSTILYEDAISMIKKLKNEGCKVYLISASPEFYLYEFYNIKEVDKIIGTKFKFNEGKLKREMEGLNCKGEEKVRRLMEVIKEEKIEVDFKKSYMFSDSLSDKPLLDLVGHPYLINFKKKHDKFEILNWK